MIDLTLIHWNINLVAVLFIISIFLFLSTSLVHSCIGTFFICYTSTCFCTSHTVLSAGTSSGAFAYSTSTPNKLDHRLWSYCNVWQVRYRNLHHTTILPWAGLEYLDFPQGLDSKHMLGHVRPEYNYVDISHQQKMGGFYRFHLNFSAVLACRSFLCQRACRKTSHSLKQHQQKAFLQHQVDLVLWVLLVLLQWMPQKSVFLPIPLICPQVSHPVKQWNPRSSAAFDVPRRTYIGFIKSFLLLSPVPISMVVWRPRTVSLWIARTITSVSWVMICTFFPALEISAVCSMIRVSASSCVLTPVDGWTSFMLLFTCRCVTVTTGIFSCKTLFVR